MSPKLKAMLYVVGTVTLGGVGLSLLTPQPATRSMADLRDAGITNGQPLVVVCPERLTAQSKRRINKAQPGQLFPKQSYARIARTARCFNPDAGNCFRPSDGLPRITDAEGEVVIPSLRRDLAGVDLDAGIADDDGGDSDDVDDSFQYRLDACEVLTCPMYNDAVDAGTMPNPFQNPFCNNLNRLALVPAECAMPDARLPDGGWDDSAGEPGHLAAPDCLCGGPYGLSDGGYRWRGVNVCPAAYAKGTQCLPSPCSIVSGDDLPGEWL
jgi:hypothetical protein